jgi:CubicO group peptidase (beta-lactamase class C family)
MRFPAALFAFLILFASTAKPQTTGVIHRLDGSKISVSDADACARKTFAAEHVTGAELAVLNKGRLVWSAAYGMRRKDPPLEMDRETTTWAASITKSLFSTYVMQLVERGEFDLDKPVASQLPKPLNGYEPYKTSPR